jgi:tRNA pseudouridine55 synthase
MSENELFSGVIAIDKPQGMTSHDVVAHMRRLYGTKQVGHTGTLDPLATGVLPVMVGRAVKASEYLTSDNKNYIAGMRLGITTDTEDVQGRVLSECDSLPSKEQVEQVLARFRGEILQIPPMYSALKVGGKKLCDLARKGVEIERTPRPVKVYRLELLQCEPTQGRYLLDVECSKGTYIRTLIADIGAALGCGGVMESLRRAKAGSFALCDTVTLEELEKMSKEQRVHALQSVETLFYDWDKLCLTPFFSRLARNGCELYLDKLGVQAPVGKRFSLYREEDGFFAVAEVQSFAEGDALKVIKLFKL